MARKPYTSLADALAQILGKRSWQNGLREAEIALHWPEIVGPEIATRTTPVKLIRGKLEVRCEHDVWRTELQFLKPEILKRIAEIEGEGVVKEIFLK
jgi:predicted nucleic acid-binding Zn ribbon protein